MTIAANLHRTRFFFLHHGETDWDRAGKLAGMSVRYSNLAEHFLARQPQLRHW